MEACRTKGIDILTYQDALYPQRLKNITDPPVVLYSRGSFRPLTKGICNWRWAPKKASPYGIKMKKLGFELIRGGGLVITGLADGVDGGCRGALLADLCGHFWAAPLTMSIPNTARSCTPMSRQRRC